MPFFTQLTILLDLRLKFLTLSLNAARFNSEVGIRDIHQYIAIIVKLIPDISEFELNFLASLRYISKI